MGREISRPKADVGLVASKGDIFPRRCPFAAAGRSPRPGRRQELGPGRKTRRSGFDGIPRRCASIHSTHPNCRNCLLAAQPSSGRDLHSIAPNRISNSIAAFSSSVPEAGICTKPARIPKSSDSSVTGPLDPCTLNYLDICSDFCHNLAVSK